MEDGGGGAETEWRILNRWQSFLVRYIPLWLLLLAPFLLFPSLTKTLALLGLPFLWWLNKREKGYFVRRTPFDWAIFVLLLMVLVSEYATFDLNFSLPKLSGFLFHIAIFYAVAEAVRTRRGLQRSLAFYFLLGLLVLGIGVLNTVWLEKVSFLATITQKLPTLTEKLPGAESGIHPNQLAGTLLWIFPLQASIVWGLFQQRKADFPRWVLPVLSTSFAFTLVVFLLTQSRGGWVGGIVALAILGSLWHRTIRWSVGIGGVGTVIAAGVIGWQKIGELLVSDTTEAIVGNLGSLGFRQEVWRVALWGLGDFPFTGMGMGTFRKVARVLYPLNVSPKYDIAHAHNQFLQTGLDLGILGMAAFLAVWLIAGFLLARTIRHTDTDDVFIKSVAVGSVASLGGYFVYALSDTVALGAKPGFFLWWLFAFSTGVYQLTEATSNDDH